MKISHQRLGMDNIAHRGHLDDQHAHDIAA
jgi:hypothetical protein